MRRALDRGFRLGSRLLRRYRLLAVEDLHAAIFGVETELQEARSLFRDERANPGRLVLLLGSLLDRRQSLARIDSSRELPVPGRSKRLLAFVDGAQQHGVNPCSVLLVGLGHDEDAGRRLLHEGVDAERVVVDVCLDLVEPALVLVSSRDVLGVPEKHVVDDHLERRGVTTDLRQGHLGQHGRVVGTLEGDRDGRRELLLLGVASLHGPDGVVHEQVRGTLRFGGEEVNFRVEGDGFDATIGRCGAATELRKNCAARKSQQGNDDEGHSEECQLLAEPDHPQDYSQGDGACSDEDQVKGNRQQDGDREEHHQTNEESPDESTGDHPGHNKDQGKDHTNR